MQHDIDLKELKFDLLTPRVGGLGSESKILTTEFLHLRFSFLIWYVLKKLNLTYWPNPQGKGRRGSAAKIFATVLLHFVIPFIWYVTMTKFWKSLNFDLLIPSQSHGRGTAVKIFGTMLMHSWLQLIWYATWPWRNSQIHLFNAQVTHSRITS